MKFLSITFFYFLFNFISLSNVEIINNPTKIDRRYNFVDNIILFELNGISSLSIIPNLYKNFYDSYIFTQSLFFFIDESNNKYLFCENKYYALDGEYEGGILKFSSSPKIISSSYNKFLGYTKSNKYECFFIICDYIYKDTILYGKTGENIYFYYLSDEKDYSVYFGNIDDDVSCKFYKDLKYVCAYGISGQIKLKCLNLDIDIIKRELKDLNNIDISGFSNHENAILYDTSMDEYKILCARKRDNKNFKCSKIRINKFCYEFLDKKDLGLSNFNNNEFTASLSYQENNCNYTKFNNEYLLCCGKIDIIKCERRNMNFELINKFSINAPGKITNLTIHSNNNNEFLSLIYNNHSESDIYEYIIFPPKCSNEIKELINSNQIKIDIDNLFERKTNTKYYIKLEQIPQFFQQISINNEIINNIYERKPLKENENYLYLIQNNNEVPKILNLNYNISIEETFSTTCKIDIPIKSCYYSCKNCSKDEDNSNDKEHNCIECCDGFFPFSKNRINCYSINNVIENRFPWFFNNKTNEFENCHTKCATCYGPSEENCLSCNNETSNNFKYLYKSSCFRDCPEGTFKNKDNEGNNICEKCHENCETCYGTGDTYDMNCKKCSNDKIIYRNNCYIIYENETKSFYNPNNISEIISCYEYHENYIIENTNICIDKVKEGYFISNNKTGLLSRCHSNCKKCSKNYTENSQNCDICRDELFLQEGNCVENCSEGYYLENNECFKCHDNCLNCEIGPIIENGKIISMSCSECKNSEFLNMIKNEGDCFPIIAYNESTIIFNISETHSDKKIGNCLYFNKAIFYGDYECISKPEHTYYILDNSDNTGIVKFCDISCDSCFGENTTQNTNCIECSLKYYKTEDSNTNCILESLIPKNYYKNETDSIYYKCHQNCYNCTEKYNYEFNDMHCLTCLANYYFLEGSNNCYNINLTENGYYLDIYNYLIEPKFKKCYENCKTCNISYTENGEMNCILCKNDFYKLNGTNNCYNRTALNNSFYFKEDMFYHCDENCLTCSDGKNDISHNCLSCDRENKGLYLVEHLNNCEYSNYSGYYLDNDDLILKRCYNSCKLCNGSLEIKNNINEENNHNCIECAENYYRLPNGLYPNNCYDNETIGLWKIIGGTTLNIGYTNLNKEISTNLYENAEITEISTNLYKSTIIIEKNTNIENTLFYENSTWNVKTSFLTRDENNSSILNMCYFTCKNCSEGPEINETGNIITQNCIKCIEGYNLLFDTRNCYNDSILEDGYYLSSNDSMYHKCDIQCKTCKDSNISNEPHCLTCNNEKGYYLAKNKPSYNCYNNFTIGNYYFLEEYYDTSKMITYKKWKLCYRTCLSCSGLGNDTFHNCDSCKPNHYFIIETKNCINEEYATNNGFYLDNIDHNFHICNIACLKCYKQYENNNTNCLECNTEQGYYPLSGKDSAYCYNNITIEKGYYLDKIKSEYIWKKCYEKCETCNSLGNSTNMNCLTCKINLLNNQTYKPYNFKITENGNCVEGCPDGFFLTYSGDCTIECSNGTYQFLHNHTCLYSCPHNYELNPEKKICVIKTFDHTTTSSEFKSKIMDNILEYVNSSKTINGSDFLAVVLTSDDMDPKEQLKKGISAVDLGNCPEIIKKHYNISKDESLIILNMESKKNITKQNEENNDNSLNIGKNNQIEIYDFSGRKLDLSVCKENIKIMKYIKDVEELDIDSAMSLSGQGIDVFNANDSFFNDLCHRYDNVDGKDIIINDRRKDIYQNVSFCQDGCKYKGMDYELMIANCICDSSSLQGDKNIF